MYVMAWNIAGLPVCPQGENEQLGPYINPSSFHSLHSVYSFSILECYFAQELLFSNVNENANYT